MTKPFEEYVPEFLAYLRDVRGGSEQTVRTYRTVLDEALGQLQLREEEGGFFVDLHAYRLAIASLHKKTIAKKISALRSFFAWLKELGLPLKIRGDAQVKIPRTLPKPVRTEYIREALEKGSSEARTILLLLYSMGLRVSELANLKQEEIRGGWARVTGKGNKTRMVPLLPEVARELERHLEENKPVRYVLEKDGKRLSENQLRYRVRTMFESIGLHVTPHQLRHAFATDLLEGGARITDVSELLGHSALTTTEIYTKLSGSLKLQNYLAAHPLCKDDDDS